MTAKDLFTIILKIFGIYLIKDVIISIPPVLKFFFDAFQWSLDVAIFSLLISLISLGFYVLIVYFLLFKTELLISKLNLTSDLSQDTLSFNMHRSTIYTIAVIISGLVILTFAIPNLVRHVYNWYQYINRDKSMFNTELFDFSSIIVAIAEVMTGLLFLGNQKLIVNYIELKSRKSNGG